MDNGDDTRGFANSAGNILVNGRRPSVKQDTPSAILARISANSVERIDLIRGQVLGIDMQGQSVIANILLKEEVPAAVQWKTITGKVFDEDFINLNGDISLTHKWKDIDYILGVQLDQHAHHWEGTRSYFFGDDNLVEDRVDDTSQRHSFVSGSFGSSTWLKKNFIEFNSRVRVDDNSVPLISIRTPITDPEPHRELFDNDSVRTNIEASMNVTRSFNHDLTTKGIFLYSQLDNDQYATQTIFDTNDELDLFRESDKNTLTQEGIVRVETNWTGLDHHFIQFNIEGAYNRLTSSLRQTVDTGAGPKRENVPGSNTKVEEYRSDILLLDNWNIGPFEVEYGLGVEVSNISQTGDAGLERDFFFLKPQAGIVYTPHINTQARLSLQREVSQLDFNDFVSVVALQDDDITLGNPNLKPESIWKVELGYEYRFSAAGAFNIALFHHWISDVEDLLPITDTRDAPGNIGDGKRWGVNLEVALPLDWLGIGNSRLDIRTRWTDSSVKDPVTGKTRKLSAIGGLGGPFIYREEDIKLSSEIKFRQDFEDERIGWGWELRSRTKRTLFKIDELDTYNEDFDIMAFVESTRWFGIKMSLIARYLTDERERIRTIYENQRSLSVIETTEIQRQSLIGQIDFVLSGNF
ncbi:MAG: TonB-dependent receptor [Gammaproteobacteria bacterium]|nr:TonB-dependent receptor [Gammaproteobacteria bacterium]